MRSASVARPAPLLVLGVIRGLESEARRVVAALDRFDPGRVALGLSPEEVEGLRTHFLDPAYEPWVPLSSSEVAYARGLASYGTVRVPSPGFIAAIRWADVHQVGTEGLEPAEDHYSELFLEHVGYVDLLRRTLAERRLVNAPPEGDDATDYALAWEERSQAGQGSRRLGEARSAYVSERLWKLHSSTGGALKSKFALLLDVERFSPVVERLRAGPYKGLAVEKALPSEGPRAERS